MDSMMAFWSVLFGGDLQWRAPLWLWALLLPPLLWFFKQWWIKVQKQSYADSHLWPWVEANPLLSKSKSNLDRSAGFKTGVLSVAVGFYYKVKQLVSPSRLLSVGWLCLIVALAGPRSLLPSPDQTSRAGVDVMVMMDLSHSMTAEDVYPSRFLQAKSLVETLVKGLQPNDRVALMGFAGQPHLVSPLSFDRDLFQHSLNLLEPDMLPTQGSWLELAAISGLHHLQQTAGNAKVMLVLSNGAPAFWKPQNLPEVVKGLPETQALRSGQTDVKTIWIGIGKPTPSSLPDKTDKTGRLHANGMLVQSRLEEAVMKKWAQTLHGIYLHGSTDQAFMSRLMEEVTLPAQSRSLPSSQQVWQDFSQPFMVMGLLALLWAFYPLTFAFGLTGQGNKDAVKKSENGVASLFMLGFAILFSTVSLSPDVQAAESSQSIKQSAYQAFQAEQYDLATSLYDQVADYDGYLGAGTSAYKAGDLESAVLYFRQAALSANDDDSRAKALFNLGNGYYLVNLLPQAIEAYRQALLYHPHYVKAEQNLALALQRKQFEDAGKNAKGEDDDGSGEGRDSEGAFYGGQKPSASSETPGFGADDVEGSSGEDKVILPQAGEITDYRFDNQAGSARLNVDQRAQVAAGSAILQRQQQLQRAQAFENQLQQLDDQQGVLLKRLFEREEGFQAAQEEAHPIPGVQPW
ncbi:VWA domain-containing protein [Thiomicrorhabdus sp.]|uniref:VWA domain-containing protein n=1 Tax=Thiomicrorhabdus sp. TaxID=2039724 RepID=UPI00356AEB75